MLTRLVVFLSLAMAVLFSPADARAERRVALVVGNSGYVHAATLRNPRNDAEDMAATLRKLGFEVLVGTDLDQAGFAKTIDQYARMIDGADVALFFYAGHGLQINEKNYLVSVNAKLDSEFMIPSETIELDAIVRLMEAKAPVGLVFLDACRNNPLTDELKRSLAATRRSANLGRGLARIEPTGRDTLIAFAAAPGQEAADGNSRNSPFTTALLKYLPQPGLEVSVMLKDVTAEVRRVTGNEQRPQQLSDMSRTFYFAKAVPVVATATDAPANAAPAPAAPQNTAAADERALDFAFWNSVQSSNDCDAFRVYLQRFPNGSFVELARLSERRLCNNPIARQITIVDAPTPPAAPAAPVAAAPAAADVKPGNTVVAALPTTTPPAAPAATPAVAATDPTYNIQLELIRLGCSSGEADGQWSAATRDSVVRFNRSAKARLDPNAPSDAMVAALRARKGRVCALECGRGFQARGNTCVAIAPAAPKAKPEPRVRTRNVNTAAAPQQPRQQRKGSAQPAQQHDDEGAAAAKAIAPVLLGTGIGIMLGRRPY